jgi:CheY-like chemotaxis protein
MTYMLCRLSSFINLAAVSNGIIKLHDGYVDVRSNPPGQPGITFSLELPVYRRTAQAFAPMASAENSVDYSSSDDDEYSGKVGAFSDEDSDYEDGRDEEEEEEEEEDERDVRISTNTMSALRMNLDDDTDEKLVLEAMVSEKEGRLARQEQKLQHAGRPYESLLDNMSFDVKLSTQSQYNTSGGQSHRPVELGPLYGCRVLLVDDSKLILRVTSKTLSSLGVVCHTALDGKQAVEMIRKVCRRTSLPLAPSSIDIDSEECGVKVSPGASPSCSGTRGRTSSASVVDKTPNPNIATPCLWNNNYFDLVMLDKQMPVMDGLQTCRELRQVGYAGTIIGVTGSCMPSEV